MTILSIFKSLIYESSDLFAAISVFFLVSIVFNPKISLPLPMYLTISLKGISLSIELGLHTL